MKQRTGGLRGALLFTAAGYLAWAAAARFFLLLAWADILGFLLFQLAAVALPGFAAAKLLRLKLSPLETLCASYGLGICALLAVYFVFAPFGAMSLIPWGVLALALASAAVLFFRRGEPLCGEADAGELRIALVFCAFAALATFAVLSCATLDPSLSGARNYYPDTLNGVALATSAARSFPMRILQMSGTVHRYHIFYFAYAAVLKLVTGLSSFEIVTKLTLITISPFAAAGLVALAKRFLRANPLTALAGVFMVVFPAGGLTVYLYSDTIGYTLGLAFMPLALLLFDEAMRRPGINRCYAVSALFLVGVLGSKGPIAVTVFFGICWCLLLRLLREKDTGVFLKGLLYAVPFFLCYFLLYAGGAGDSMSFLPLYKATSTAFAKATAGRLPALLWKILCTAQYIAASDATLFLGFVCAVACVFIYKKERPVIVDFAVGGYLVGYTLLNLFSQMGSSEGYFVNILGPAAVILALLALSALLRRAKEKKSAGPRVAFGAAVCLCLGVFVPAALGCVRTYIGNPTYDSYKNCVAQSVRYSRFSDTLVTSQADIDALEEAGTRRSAVTPLEYEGLLWLRDNTPADAVICDGRYLTNNKYFDGTAFSERAFYLEGWGYVTMEDSNGNTDEKVRRDSLLHLFYENRDEKLIPLISAEGMDYIIVTQYQTPGWALSDKYCDLVFSNRDIAIYRTHDFG
ncbi:MAG: hypothetical protein VB021_05170 [Oscillospiraceae bacterium]|nr:hypothetical protein [Oscillospiraceae bacterium]